MRAPDHTETITPARGLTFTVRYWFEVEDSVAPEDSFDTSVLADEAQEIRERQEAGDLWAWYCILVEVECQGFTGRDMLGGCSGAEGSGIAEALATAEAHGMVDEARADLAKNLLDARNTGIRAKMLANRLARLGAP